MSKQKKKMAFTILLVIVAIGLKFYRGWDDHQVPKRDGSVSSPAEGAFSEKFTPVKTSGNGWELLSRCKLITGRNSDGDSFHVKHEKGENQFRLYFVDTPESYYKKFKNDSLGKRLKAQGDYFGGLDREQTIKVGKEAKAFTLGLLKSAPFRVITKWEDVHGPGREHAFVIVGWEGKDVYLHELLVAQGLVRIHTRGANMPGGGRRRKAQKKFLQTWERQVKAQGIGGWGM